MDKSKISNNLLYSQKHFDLLVQLNKLSFTEFNNLTHIYDVITETLVEGLNIDRASFWRIQEDKLICVNLYLKDKERHSSIDDLNSIDLPIYFKALESGIAIVADDVYTNPYTSELIKNYFVPLGITDMMDIPIREDGIITGVLCCEHKDDARGWSETDLAFAKSVSDILSILLEQGKRRGAELDLIESQRKLSLITNNARDAFVVFENGVVTYLSNSYSDFLGFSRDELMFFTPEDIFERMHPDDVDNVKTFIYDQLNKQEKNFKYEFRIKTKAGKYVWREDSASILYDNNGKYIKYILISRDISEVKRAREKIEKLFTISKIQNLKLIDFTHIISHNIRSNTSNMTMLIQLIEETTDKAEKDEFFQLLKESNKKLSDTIYQLNETINVQLSSSIKKSGINLRTAVEQTLIAINLIIKIENVQININISPNLEIKTIPAYFDSIIFNLITNAVKYRVKDRKPIITITAEKIDSKIIISVQDNGLGIDLKRNKDKLFGMYKTFHGNADAVGLGLFMTKNHIQALGGKIEVESELNVGTTFIVTLNE